ncbi:MAG TPA: FHA domain-containing protein [Anaerolineales bacterium]|nr:FHA domain-containing protein [Anaerolineales bacterium]
MSKILGTLYAQPPDGRVLVYAIEEKTSQIGRGVDVEISIPDFSIAPNHALLVWLGQRFAIEDLGSTLGTQLDTVRLQTGQLYELPVGAEILFGAVRAAVVHPGEPIPDWANPYPVHSTLPPTVNPAIDIPLPPEAQPEPAPAEAPPTTEEVVPRPVLLSIEPTHSDELFLLRLTNTTNQTLQIDLRAADRESILRYDFAAEGVELAAGEMLEIELAAELQPEVKYSGDVPFLVQGFVNGQSMADVTGILRPRRLKKRVVLAGLAILMLLLAFLVALAGFGLCPTVLDGRCPAPIAGNFVSDWIATRTQLPSSTPLPSATPTATVPPTETATPLQPTTTFTASPSPEPSLTPTLPPYNGALVYRLQSPEGVSLFVSSPPRTPVVLVEAANDVLLLDTYVAGEASKLAIWVLLDEQETLWLMRVDGSAIQIAINPGWQSLLSARWTADGSWLMVQAVTDDETRYYVFDGDSGDLLQNMLINP